MTTSGSAVARTALDAVRGGSVENGRNGASARPRETSDAQFHIRAPLSSTARWKSAARRCGMSLAEWTRLRLDQASEDGSPNVVGEREVPHAYENDPVRTALDVVRLNPMIDPLHVLAAVRFCGLSVPHSWKAERFWNGLLRHRYVVRAKEPASGGDVAKLTPKGWRKLMGFVG